jgi:hypothetical protein
MLTGTEVGGEVCQNRVLILSQQTGQREGFRRDGPTVSEEQVLQN